MHSFIYNVLDGLWIEKAYFSNSSISTTDKKIVDLVLNSYVWVSAVSIILVYTTGTWR